MSVRLVKERFVGFCRGLNSESHIYEASVLPQLYTSGEYTEGGSNVGRPEGQALRPFSSTDEYTGGG